MLLLVAIPVVIPSLVEAQPADVVSVVVVDRAGKLMRMEQFIAETHEGCTSGSGSGSGTTPQAHFHARSRGAAIALDLSEVPDPDPRGCGYGMVTGGFPASALVRVAQTRAAVLTAWSTKTGLEGLAVPTPPAVESPALWRRLLTGDLSRVLIVIPLALVAGLAIGVFVYRREQRHSVAAPYEFRFGTGAMRDASEDGGGDSGPMMNERLARGHAGLLAPVEVTSSSVVVPVEPADEPDEIDASDRTP